MAHKSRLITTFLAVSLGVAFIGGVLVLTDTVNSTFDDLFSDVYAEHRRGRALERGDRPGLRRRRRGPRPDRREPARRGARRRRRGRGRRVGRRLRPHHRQGRRRGRQPGHGRAHLRRQLARVARCSTRSTISDGQPPSSDDEVVIDRGCGRGHGLRGRRHGRGPDPHRRQGVHAVRHRPVRQRRQPGRRLVRHVDRRGGPGAAGRARQGRHDRRGGRGRHLPARAGVPDPGRARRATPGVEVITGQQITEETQDDIQQALGFLTIFLGFFALIALVVGSFVIYNAFSIIVAQRTREMALLRAVGARRRQVRRAVLVEAIVVGVAGSVVGFLLGLGVAFLLSCSSSSRTRRWRSCRRSVLIALAVGIIVTLLSALIPAWRASRVPPLAAMRDVAVDTGGRSRVRLIVGLVILVAAVALLVAGAFGSWPLYVGLGVLGLLIVAFLIGPVVARPVAGVLGAPVARLRGVSGELARDNAVRNPRRTALTAFALTIGVGPGDVLPRAQLVHAGLDRQGAVDGLQRRLRRRPPATSVWSGCPRRWARRSPSCPRSSRWCRSGSPLRSSATTPPPRDRGRHDRRHRHERRHLRPVRAGRRRGQTQPGVRQVVINRDNAKRQPGRRRHGGDPVPRRRAAARPTARHGPASTSRGRPANIGSYVIGLDDYDAAMPTQRRPDAREPGRRGVGRRGPAGDREIVDQFATAEVQSVEEYKDMIGSQLDDPVPGPRSCSSWPSSSPSSASPTRSRCRCWSGPASWACSGPWACAASQLRSSIRWESAIIALFGTVLGLAFGLVGGWGIIRSLSGGLRGFPGAVRSCSCCWPSWPCWSAWGRRCGRPGGPAAWTS